MNAKKFLLLSVVLIFFLIILLFFLRFSRQQTTQPNVILPTPTPVQIPQISPVKINISGVQVDDFISHPITTNPQGDVEFVRKQDSQAIYYQIVYLKQFNSFIIDLHSSSQEVRTEAELEFLNKLGVTKEEACKLTVHVSAPYIPNPDLVVQKRSLSFCENKK